MNSKTRSLVYGVTGALGIGTGIFAGADFVKRAWEDEVLGNKVRVLSESLSDRVNESLKGMSVTVAVEPSVDPRSEIVAWSTYGQVVADIERMNASIRWKIVTDALDRNPELKELRQESSEVRTTRANELLLWWVSAIAGILTWAQAILLTRSRRRVNRRLAQFDPKLQELIRATTAWKAFERSGEEDIDLSDLLNPFWEKIYSAYLSLPELYQAAVLKYLETHPQSRMCEPSVRSVIRIYNKLYHRHQALIGDARKAFEDRVSWDKLLAGKIDDLEEIEGMVQGEPGGFASFVKE